MIKSPFTIYFDIETYSQHLKKTNQKITSHEKLLKPYLVSYILKCNYNLPKTKKFGCVGRGDLTSLFFSKVVKY